jgi:hypothetical protein
MDYADAATPALTSFGTTDDTTIPHIGGRPAAYMHVPAFTGLANGYVLSLTDSGPNGGGSYINQYTFLLDVLIPTPINWTPFFNTDPQNGNDADFYVAPDGSIGIGSIYSAAGVISTNTWYRIGFAADLAAGTLAYYVNGASVASGTLSGELDGRWSLYSNADPGPDLLLFNESDDTGVYTHEMYVHSVAVVDWMLTASEMAALGNPRAEGIFVRKLRIQLNGPNVDLSWDGAPNVRLERSNDLVDPQWGEVSDTLGASSYSEERLNDTTFYRLRAD